MSEREFSVGHGDRSYRVSVADDGSVSIDGARVHVARAPREGEIVVARDEIVDRVYIAIVGGTTWAFHNGRVYELAVDSEEGAQRRTTHHQGSLLAPMPAAVVAVQVSAGTPVKRGDVLMILEAMKMELPIRAPGDGVVKAVNCRPGDMVQAGASLLEME
jgi:acetyl/propionyl-CoA carboxylase alpha subunit